MVRTSKARVTTTARKLQARGGSRASSVERYIRKTGKKVVQARKAKKRSCVEGYLFKNNNKHYFVPKDKSGTLPALAIIKKNNRNKKKNPKSKTVYMAGARGKRGVQVEFPKAVYHQKEKTLKGRKTGKVGKKAAPSAPVASLLVSKGPPELVNSRPWQGSTNDDEEPWPQMFINDDSFY